VSTGCQGDSLVQADLLLTRAGLQHYNDDLIAWIGSSVSVRLSEENVKKTRRNHGNKQETI
ncbi:MAG: hypothetical protein ACK4VP_08420, partial [Nitrospira sp.]